MRGRQPLHVTKTRCRVVAVQSKQQKVANRRVVELVGHFGMNSNAIQRVAEQKKVTELCVVEWPDTEMIPGAKKVLRSRIPNRKRKIAAQMLHAGGSPNRIRVKDQFRVRSRTACLSPGSFHLRNQFLPAIETRIRHNPKLAFEAHGVLFTGCLTGRPQHRVCQTHRPIQPNRARIRSTSGEGISKALQERPHDGLTVPMKNASDPAQSLRLSM